MNPIKIRNLSIGEGGPKICVPIVATSVEEILRQAKEMEESCADLVEWRVDWFDAALDIEAIKTVLVKLREVLRDMPILFTFRSKREGGEKAITYEQYEELLLSVARTCLADMIDVEVFMDDRTTGLIAKLHEEDAIVVGSYHDFCGTPRRDWIVNRLCEIQDRGADIPKMAVMPQNKTDVMILLGATYDMMNRFAKGPLVTMSMSDIGLISRICGEFFGSAITFASAGKASAPGQIDAKDLRMVLDIMYQKQDEKKA